MLTYTPPKPPEAVRPTEKPWLLLLLVFIWLWPGIFGHDPWRPDEPYVLGIVQSFLDTGNWLVPHIVGVPYLESPPLYHWLAAIFAAAFSPWLMPMHDAMRIATPVLAALSLWCMGLSGRDLLGKHHGRSVVLILIGSLGLMMPGHVLSTDIAVFFGFSLGFYALSQGLTQGWRAGALLAAASVILLLSSSLMEVALLLMVALMLPAFRAWRGRESLRMLIVALTLGLPAALVWPLLLNKSHPELFNYWWEMQALGPFNGFGRLAFLHDFGYYFKNFPWFTWPAWPLAGWALWRRRAHLDHPAMQIALLFFGVLIVLLTLSPKQTQALALPLLLPLALLAASELDSLRRGASAFLNWFGLMTFGLLGVFIWAGWLAMNFGWPHKLAERSLYFSPAYVPQVSGTLLLIAVIASSAWLWAVTRSHMRGRQAVTNWAAGATLVWGLAMSLWLPWFDAQKSYRAPIHEMMRVLPTDSCVATAEGNQAFRALWYYFEGLKMPTTESAQGRACRYRLIRQLGDAPQPIVGWTTLWKGHRAGDRDERLLLIQRDPATAP